MAGRPRRRGGRPDRARAAALPSAPRDLPAALAAGAIALAFLFVGLAVDSGAHSAFDAPKRLAALFFTAAAAAALAFSAWRKPTPADGWTSPRRLALLFAAAALAWMAVSAMCSPRSPSALDSARVVLLFALLPLVGASRAVRKRRGLLTCVFLAVAAVNAIVSILQARGIYQPFALAADTGSRESTGAYAGNVGYLAVTLALAAVAALVLALKAPRPGWRALAACGLALFGAGLLVNRNLTSLTAFAVGAAIVFAAFFGRRALAPGAAALALLCAAVALYAPMRSRVTGAVDAARSGDWNRLVTYRVGAWKAAASMARERPLLGFGPGTFEAEFVSHRLAAEIASGRRYINPLRTASYAEAHCDYLQPFAEWGFPGGLAALAAAGCLFVGLFRTARRRDSGPREEAVFLLAFLGAGAAAALTWFPLQRPISAIPLLLAAGRAWRISGADDEPSPEVAAAQSKAGSSPGSWRRLLAGAAAALVLARADSPELARYRSERMLRAAESALRFLVTRPSEVSDPPAALDRIAAAGAEAAGGLPGDPRPWILAGGAKLVKGQPEEAIENYRVALDRGERAETDLNLGRAYEALGDPLKARAAFLRAAWISPFLLGEMLPDIALPLREEVARLESELAAGRLEKPPPLPE